MADGNPEVASSSQDKNAESTEAAVEVNVKTLDSQIYKFRVNKNMPVSVFKEKIASAVGLPVGQQRLIYRGRVLKDDHLLSEYHLEDGHTLHLVVRQPVQSQSSPVASSSETSGSQENRGNDPTPGAPRNRVGQVSHSVVLGTFNVGDQGEGLVPDISRVIGAVLNSVGIGGLNAAGGAGNMASSAVNSTTQPSQSVETEGARDSGFGSSRSQGGNQGQTGQAFLNLPFQTPPQPLQFPPLGAVPIPSLQMVIPDSLMTISEFINRLELALSPSGNAVSSSPASSMGPNQEAPSSNARGLPTPVELAAVIRQAQQLLSGHAGVALMNLVGRLEREGSTADAVTRSQIQAEAMQVGVAMQHLGALLLELGRTILTLRMGQSPAESVVNAGPAVYISSTGPNPIMVQPSPYLNSSPFSISSAVIPQSIPGIAGPVGLGDVPRHINIHIHAGSSVAPGISSVGARVNTGEATNVGQNPNQAQGTTNGTGSTDSAPRRVLPVRSVVAAVPARSAGEAAGHVLSVFYPLHARSQQPTSNMASTQVSNPATSDGGQVNSGTSASQNSQPISLPAAMTQEHVESRDVANIKHAGGGSQASSVVSPAQDISVTSNTCDGEGNHHLESVAIDGSGMTSGAIGSFPPHTLEVDSISDINKEDVAIRSSMELAPSNSAMGESSDCLTVEASSSKSEGQPSVRAASGVSSDHATSSSRSHEASEGCRTVPLGLGAGGLQPKMQRRSKQVKPQVKDGGANTSLSVDQNQNRQPASRGQEVLQSLMSGLGNLNTAVTNGSSGQLPPLFRQVMDSLPLEGQGANGQTDVASMMSQVLRSPAMDNLLAGVSEQAGVGSATGLRGILEQLTQSPSVRNTLNQIAQEVEGASPDHGNILSGLGSGQGGLNFSRMFQQLMPVVSQALGQGPTHPESSLLRDVALESQSRRTDVEQLNDQVDGSFSKTDRHQAVEQLDGLHSPSNVFRAVVENASNLHGEGNAGLVEEICSDETLASEFMEMLQRDLHRQLHPGSRSADKS